jgi:cysteinyl-tRNA synthetase
MHNGFINIDNQKMSKSLGNFFTVRDISKEFDLEAVGMFMLGAHYRSPINFSRDQIVSANASLQRLYTARDQMLFLKKNAQSRALSDEEKQLVERLAGYEKRFDDAMDDDLNTADAIGAIFEEVKDLNSNLNSDSSLEVIEAALASFKGMTDVLGLVQRQPTGEDDIPEEIRKMAEERAAARKEKNWKRSDELRDAIKAAGYILEDTPQGQKIRKNM